MAKAITKEDFLGVMQRKFGSILLDATRVWVFGQYEGGRIRPATVFESVDELAEDVVKLGLNLWDAETERVLFRTPGGTFYAAQLTLFRARRRAAVKTGDSGNWLDTALAGDEEEVFS
jgi:hypothetical protein